MSAQKNMYTKKRILCVDDDKMLRGLYVRLLTLGDEYEVEVAGNASEAMRMIASDATETADLAGPPYSRFDAVITDLNMPGIDGAGLVAMIRQGRFTMPIILATGDVGAIAPVEGIAALLRKPFEVKKLLAAVAGLFDDGEVEEEVTRPIRNPFLTDLED